MVNLNIIYIYVGVNDPTDTDEWQAILLYTIVSNKSLKMQGNTQLWFKCPDTLPDMFVQDLLHNVLHSKRILQTVLHS